MKWQGWTVAAAWVLTAAAAQAADDPKDQFQARYTELRAAMTAHDQAAIAKLTTPDFTMTDIRGETHTGAEMAQMGGRMGGGHRHDGNPPPGGTGPATPAPATPGAAPAAPQRTVETTVLSAAVTGEVAQVHQQLHMAMKREGDDGEVHAMDIVILSDDTWVHKGDGWLLQKSVQKDLTVKRDGEEFFHQAADGAGGGS